MFRIAHLSDLHLIEDGVRSRRGVSRIQLEYLSLLKKIDPVARRERAERALTAAAAANPDHVVITGDLEGARAFAPCGVVSGDRPVRVYTIEGKRLVPTTPAAVGRAARRGTGMPDEAPFRPEPSFPPPPAPA